MSDENRIKVNERIVPLLLVQQTKLAIQVSEVLARLVENWQHDPYGTVPLSLALWEAETIINEGDFPDKQMLTTAVKAFLTGGAISD